MIENTLKPMTDKVKLVYSECPYGRDGLRCTLVHKSGVVLMTGQDEMWESEDATVMSRMATALGIEQVDTYQSRAFTVDCRKQAEERDNLLIYGQRTRPEGI